MSLLVDGRLSMIDKDVTQALANLVERTVGRRGKLHPATKPHRGSANAGHPTDDCTAYV